MTSTTPSRPITTADNINLIVFRGLNNVLDKASVFAFAKKHNATLMVFSYFQVAEAGDYMKHLKGPIDIIGFSRGARSAYELADAHPNIPIRRLITIGSFHTVTSSFGNGKRPPLRNVGEHRNYIESHQQPQDFDKNPINISLGPIIHYDSVKAVLDILEKEETCQ